GRVNAIGRGRGPPGRSLFRVRQIDGCGAGRQCVLSGQGTVGISSMRWARRLPGRFAGLERLCSGAKGRRVTWSGERLALVRSSQGLVAIAVAPIWQLAAFTLGGASLAALLAGLVVAGVFQGANERQAREIVALRGEVRTEAERADQAERERTASLIEAGR